MSSSVGRPVRFASRPVFHKAAAQDLRKRPLASYVLDLFDGNTRPSVRDGKSGADFWDR